MACMIQKIRKWESAFNQEAERFLFRHPVLGFLGIFIGVPIFVLIAVCVGTTLMMLPVSWLLDWL
ncbi:hypothetical protein DSECCO2_312620 [anaerobic digester metagenome]